MAQQIQDVGSQILAEDGEAVPQPGEKQGPAQASRPQRVRKAQARSDEGVRGDGLG
jgi:hypothetical protein